MLEYCKTILRKVSFSEKLFEKELKKALTRIKKEERRALIDWCKSQFKDKQLVLQRING